MKIRYVKIFGLPYYTKEYKKTLLSRWKTVTNCIGQVIPFRYVNGKFQAEWKFSGAQQDDNPVINQ